MDAFTTPPPELQAGIDLDALAERPIWVAWRNEPRGPDAKPTKIPHGRAGLAKADDAATWLNHHDAKALAARIVNGNGGGVGIELSDLGGGVRLGGVDLDTCRAAATGEIAAWAREVIDRLASYTEISPSGTGVKLYFLYDAAALPDLRAATRTEWGRAWKRGAGAHPPGIELYLGNRFFAVTGDVLPVAPITINPVSAETLLWVIEEAGPAFAGKPDTGRKSAPHGATDAGGILGRLDRAAAAVPRLRAVLDRLSSYGSRSEAAMALGGAIRAAGWSFQDMAEALRAHPATADWTAEKGEPAGGRELRRIWDRADPGEAGTEAGPWPEPDLSLIRAEAIPAPAWPAEVLPPFWQTWSSAAAEGAGAPQAFVATALLAAAGAAIGNSRWASPWASWREPPAIFAALIGRPSSGKSPALDVVQDLLTYAEAEENADWPERRRQHQSALAEAKERRTVWEAEVKVAVRDRLAPPDLPAEAEEPEPEQRRRMFTTESTVEKAARVSEPNPRGLILIRDELSGWLAGMDRYSGTAGGDRPFWLQSYGGRPWTQDRVKDPEPILIPHLLWSILGTMQPDRVASLMTAGDDDGLTARFFMCWPDPLPPRRPSCRADTEGARRAILRLRRLPWAAAPEPVVLPLAPGAIDALDEWRAEVARMETDAAGLMLSWIGKLPGLAVRLGLILELLAWAATPERPEPAQVSEAALVAALSLLESFALPMARRTFGAAGLPQVERDARRLARWLAQQRPLPETVNARRLRQMGDGPGIPDAERMEAALMELAAAGWTRPAPSRDGGPGRARKDWAVNPRLVEVAP